MKILYILKILNVKERYGIINYLDKSMLNKVYYFILNLNQYKIFEMGTRIRIVKEKNSNKLNLIRGGVFIEKLINTKQPEIVYIHTFYTHLFSRATSIFFEKTKYITSKDGIINIADILTNISQKNVEIYIQNGLITSMQCIYNGINFEKFKKKNRINKIKKILYLGQISKEKFLIDIVTDLKDPKYTCDIIGDRNQLQKIKDCTLTKGNADKINFLGKRIDVPEIIKKHDILFLTSYTEGLPTVLIEAIAAKVLVLTTDCGGLNEILKDFEFLVAKNDHKEDFLNKLHSLEKQDPNLLMNALHLKVREKFSKEKYDCLLEKSLYEYFKLKRNIWLI